MGIAVITAIFGNYDDIPPVPVGFDEAILVSDVPINSDWKNIIHRVPVPPRLAGKLPKFRPDLFTDLNSSVWIDAAARDTGNQLIEIASESLKEFEISAFSHPERNCAFEEAEYCFDWPKYRNWPIKEQMSMYLKDQFPRNFGLWECGIIVRRHSDNLKKFGTEWLFQNTFWSIQDQLSFSYLSWKLNIPINSIEGQKSHYGIKWQDHTDDLTQLGGFTPYMDHVSLSNEFRSAQTHLESQISVVERQNSQIEELKKLIRFYESSRVSVLIARVNNKIKRTLENFSH